MARPAYRHEVIQPEDQSIKIIPLTSGQNTIIEASNYAEYSQWNWRALWFPKIKCYYAARNKIIDGRPRNVLMHREILGISGEEKGDHINHDTLDNRRSNLRIATHAQNMQNKGDYATNTSGEKGVAWHSQYQHWEAYINVNGKRIRLGYFPRDRKDEAIAVRRAATIRYHGEFAFSSAHRIHPR